MSNILDELNKRFEEQTTDRIEKREEQVIKRVITAEAKAFLQEMRALKEEGKELEIAFSDIDGKGILSYRVNDVLLCCDSKRMIRDEYDYAISARSGFIGKTIYCKIGEVNEDTATVWFDPIPHSNIWIEKNDVTDEIDRKLKVAEEAKMKGLVPEYPVVIGRVLTSGDFYAGVNILDSHVYGRARINDWAPEVVQNLESVAKKGALYKFEVIEKRKTNGIQYYVLRHAKFAENLFEQIPENIQSGSVIAVRCIKVEPLRNRWWGVPCNTESLPEGLQIMGVYRGRELEPIEGLSYRCGVVKIDRAARSLVVRARRQNTEDTLYGILKK